MTSGDDERIDLWRQPDGYWRWRYTSEGSECSQAVRFLSNKEFTNEPEARETAGVAFPGVPIRFESRADRGRRWRGFLVIVIATALASAVVRRLLHARSRRRT